LILTPALSNHPNDKQEAEPTLRGLAAATGEWCLVCLAFNFKRMHTLMVG
jgi:hypothetical protein